MTFVLSNKAVGPGKNPTLINVGPTSILESRVIDREVYNASHTVYVGI